MKRCAACQPKSDDLSLPVKEAHAALAEGWCEHCWGPEPEGRS